MRQLINKYQLKTTSLVNDVIIMHNFNFSVEFFFLMKWKTYSLVTWSHLNPNLKWLAFLKPCQISKMKLFLKMVNSFQPLTIFARRSLLDVWVGSGHLRPLLTHFVPLVSFDTPWKHQKAKCFLMFSGGIEIDQCYEMA